MLHRTVLLALCLPLFAAAIDKRFNLSVPMRDGMKLSANLYRPSAQGKFPVILVRDHGYAVMVQDVRGKYGSEGVFDVWRQEAPDGEDTLTL